jgi:hypothetical protein
LKNTAQTESTIAISIHCVPANHMSTLKSEAMIEKTTAKIDSQKATFDIILFFTFLQIKKLRFNFIARGNLK